MSNYDPQQGSLERLGIPVETTPPESVLTSGKAKSIRFRVSHPQGYAFGDVESFIFDHIQPTLDWYANALYQRDLAVHKLGELVDHLEVDIANLRGQVENKQYNEALGLAVDEAEKGDETDYLLARIRDLEAELEEAKANEGTLQEAPIQAPDGEYYTREEVEGFIAAEVAAAEARKDEEFANAGYFSPEDVQKMLAEQHATPSGYTQEELDAAVAQARVETTPDEDSYTAEEVEGYIKAAVEEAEKAKDAQYETALATAVATTTGYTEDELQDAVAEAVKAKEVEILASLPKDVQPKDQLDELTDEGDLSLRAENRTLRESLAQMDKYSKELENYIEVLEGRTPAPETDEESPTDSYGRPLPKIRPEDL